MRDTVFGWIIFSGAIAMIVGVVLKSASLMTIGGGSALLFLVLDDLLPARKQTTSK